MSKCLHDKAPRYLADLCIPVTSVEGRHQLRSATTGTLLLPRVWTSTGQQSFAVFGPATWNILPPSLRAPELRTQLNSTVSPTDSVICYWMISSCILTYTKWLLYCNCNCIVSCCRTSTEVSSEDDRVNISLKVIIETDLVVRGYVLLPWLCMGCKDCCANCHSYLLTYFFTWWQGLQKCLCGRLWSYRGLALYTVTQ